MSSVLKEQRLWAAAVAGGERESSRAQLVKARRSLENIYVAIFEQPHRSRRFCPLPSSTPLISQSSREETVVRKLTPLFGLMGKVNYMGGSGKGQFAK
ncbi:hypothetical protein M0R45_022551 [Rubus argutus]|uniref:Uncharacterized protein n=1 Tax=Rubus argutus TaxID=59490 RepID=A0AAW1XGD0_RUBAR